MEKNKAVNGDAQDEGLGLVRRLFSIESRGAFTKKGAPPGRDLCTWEPMLAPVNHCSIS